MGAKTLLVEMVTPQMPALETSADSVVLPAFEGEMGVLPGHAPFLVQLKPGEVRVSRAEGPLSLAVSGGFAEILDDKVSIFAETAEMSGEINEERARQALERAKAELVAKSIDPMTLAQAEASLKRAQVRLRVAELRRRRAPSGPAGH